MQISYNIISSNKLYNLELTLSQDIFSVDQSLGQSLPEAKRVRQAKERFERLIEGMKQTQGNRMLKGRKRLRMDRAAR